MQLADRLIDQALSGLIEAENLHELRLRSRMLPERKIVRLMEKKSTPDPVGQDSPAPKFVKKHEKDCEVFGRFVSEEEKDGYVMRTYQSSAEYCRPPKKGEKTMEMSQAYTFDGAYIGNEDDAKFLTKKMGIAPEKKSKDVSVCSIGYCEKEDKWYGWSHRAICGFGIGDMIFEERFGDDSTPFVKHGSKPIKTMADAKLAAKRFADSVS